MGLWKSWWTSYCLECDDMEITVNFEVEVEDSIVLQVFEAKCESCGATIPADQVQEIVLEKESHENAEAREWDELGRYGL